jgi:hypothetical protein
MVARYFTAVDGRNGASTSNSGSYPIDQVRCVPLNTAAGAALKDVFKVVVHADGGDTNQADRTVQYADNDITATFECTGTTLDFACHLLV